MVIQKKNNRHKKREQRGLLSLNGKHSNAVAARFGGKYREASYSPHFFFWRLFFFERTGR
jgi:hypothetical protein